MTYDIRFEQMDTFLHAVVAGANSRENVVAYLADVSRECGRRQCFRILIEERLEGPRLGTLDVFAIASEGNIKELGKFEAIAYVDVFGGKFMDFAEGVAVNRGIAVAIFRSVGEAEHWIANQYVPRSGSG